MAWGFGSLLAVVPKGVRADDYEVLHYTDYGAGCLLVVLWAQYCSMTVKIERKTSIYSRIRVLWTTPRTEKLL